jgi:hypothetical protein
MTRFLTLLAASIFLLAQGGTRASDTPLPDGASVGAATPIDVDHTASIVGIQIGARMAAFIFISKDGKHLNVGADDCARSEKCQDIMAQLGRNGQTDLIHFESSHDDAVPAAADDAPSDNAPVKPIPGVSTDTQGLPHRSLREIDIQGHQAGNSTDYCPGQYQENVPESGLFLYCWGQKL